MKTERIAIDPAIMMGKPVIRGTRITVELILRRIAEGAGEGELLEDYPHLTKEDIRAAVVYGAASVAHEEVVLRVDMIDLESYRVAKETRNLEIALFWQRSNYFLVLNTAIAVGFFSLRDPKYTVALGILGLVVSLFWIAVNLGSKFWQSRWEHRLRLVEQKLRPNMDLFSASWETVQKDVRDSFQFRRRGPVHSAYTRLVLLKPSVTLMMTLLSVAFAGFWILVLSVAIFG